MKATILKRTFSPYSITIEHESESKMLYQELVIARKRLDGKGDNTTHLSALIEQMEDVGIKMRDGVT